MSKGKKKMEIYGSDIRGVSLNGWKLRMNENGTNFGGVAIFCYKLGNYKLGSRRANRTLLQQSNKPICYSFNAYTSYNIILGYRLQQQNNTNLYARQGFYQ